MTLSDVYLQLQAAREGRAIRRTTKRHLHLSDSPLVITGYHLAGDRGAPVALKWGIDPDESRPVLVVPEPRDRSLRFEVLAAFASDLCAYLDDPSNDDPQIILPNPATANWLFEVVGRFTWNLPTTGDGSVPEVVPRAGKHLMFLGQEFHHPGGSTATTAVQMLTGHFRTGQSPEEDLNLGALLGWVVPRPGSTGPATALVQEEGPPAGPVSAPNWDRDWLEPQVRAWADAAGDSDAQASVLRRLRAHADTQLAVPYEYVWTALELLRHLPAGSRVDGRRARDIGRFHKHLQRMQDGEARFSAKPSPQQAATRLSIVEEAHADHESGLLLDDPLLLAAVIAEGSAVAGRVVAVNPTNRDPVVGSTGQIANRIQPVLTIETYVETLVVVGDELCLASNPSVRGVLRSTSAPVVSPDAASVRSLVDAVHGAGHPPSGGGGSQRVELTVVGGALTKNTIDRLPRVGDLVVFSGVAPPKRFTRADPPDELPWTHQSPNAPDGSEVRPPTGTADAPLPGVPNGATATERNVS